MTLKDLKQGMVCKLRNGKKIIVANMGYCFTSGNLVFALEEKYNEDLTHKECNLTHKRYKHLDIMEITYGDKVVFKRYYNKWYVPEIGEEYYFLGHYGDVNSFSNNKDKTDDRIINNQRVFKTREEAEKRLRQQQATLSVERWIAENDVEVDVLDEDVEKYFIYYELRTKELKINCYISYIIAPKQFILSSEEKAKQLIKEREKELKIMFGVEVE